MNDITPYSPAGNTSVLLNGTPDVHGPGMGGPPMGPPGGFADIYAIVFLSILCLLIVFIGIVGNALIVFVILVDRKMRNSATTMFILNLAVADFIVTVFGIPDITMFMMNKGWLIGDGACKFIRFMLVTALFTSILTLLAVCIERFIAIIQPIKAHIFCARKKVLIVICFIWPIAFLFGLPTLLFNVTIPPVPGAPVLLCLQIFPEPHRENNLAMRYTEFFVFYLIPILAQVVLYTMVSKRLFAGTEELHAQQPSGQQNGGKAEKGTDNLKARRGVVTMLIACVILYFISYSPVQVLLIYNTFAEQQFHTTWKFHVSVMVMAHINSAANPILYGIFSQNFRNRFKRYICYACVRARGYERATTNMESFDSRVSGRRTTLSKTQMSTV